MRNQRTTRRRTFSVSAARSTWVIDRAGSYLRQAACPQEGRRPVTGPLLSSSCPGSHPSVCGIATGRGSGHTGGMAGYCAVGVMVPRTPNRYARATSALYSASEGNC